MPNTVDQVNFADPLATSMVAFSMASSIQDFPLGQQVVATGMLFMLLCKTSGIDVRETLDKIDNLVDDSDPYHHRQVAALKQLIREEYLK